MRFGKTCGFKETRAGDGLGSLSEMRDNLNVSLERKGLIGAVRLNGFKDEQVGLRKAFFVVFLSARLAEARRRN